MHGKWNPCFFQGTSRAKRCAVALFWLIREKTKRIPLQLSPGGTTYTSPH
ncbi:hypothetical protein AB434_2817 [Heyndrickxia coagulans]|uniref:Uncharacterized protein n=1 Tax=Heyndrickxia coagulans TaxID=1398 RepID=A0A0C5CCL9_HEYCO|nr:hypothetical protein SB48_HM08orf03946 [Heyndrickxia coagulans]AKN55222.1 hypothetical protein AB434_2817 [Heyndrickxia coagulans]KWZ76237.1 hypothetical protein HMPREF3213_03990 [Heyndrickxia coagulans]